MQIIPNGPKAGGSSRRLVGEDAMGDPHGFQTAVFQLLGQLAMLVAVNN